MVPIVICFRCSLHWSFLLSGLAMSCEFCVVSLCAWDELKRAVVSVSVIAQSMVMVVACSEVVVSRKRISVCV